MSAPPVYPPELDADRSNIILVVGSKGSGKSVYARKIYQSYPYDKIAIDPTGDAEPGPGAKVMRPPFPMKFPVDSEGYPVNVHAVVSTKSPTFRDDMDRAVDMGLFPRNRPCLVWVDEVGELMTAVITPPATRTMLMSSRHYGPASLLMCGPRPMHISALSISQADRVVIYDLPNPKDVQRLAENMGYPARTLIDAVEVTQQRNAELRESGRADEAFWHLVYDRQSKRIWRMPPVPVVAHRGPKS